MFATAGCIAGTDPEKIQRLPNLEGLKNEVIMPRESRNVYDHAIRDLNVKVIEVERRMNCAMRSARTLRWLRCSASTSAARSSI